MLIHFPFVEFSFGSGANLFSPFNLCLALELVIKVVLKEMLSRVNIDEQKVGKAIGRWKLWHDPIVDGQGRRLGTICSDGRKSFVLEDLSSPFGSRLHLSLFEERLLIQSLGETKSTQIPQPETQALGYPSSGVLVPRFEPPHTISWGLLFSLPLPL
jgi:hypothetical protein